jgi:hypothetical protein
MLGHRKGHLDKREELKEPDAVDKMKVRKNG